MSTQENTQDEYAWKRGEVRFFAKYIPPMRGNRVMDEWRSRVSKHRPERTSGMEIVDWATIMAMPHDDVEWLMGKAFQYVDFEIPATNTARQVLKGKEDMAFMRENGCNPSTPYEVLYAWVIANFQESVLDQITAFGEHGAFFEGAVQSRLPQIESLIGSQGQ